MHWYGYAMPQRGSVTKQRPPADQQRNRAREVFVGRISAALGMMLGAATYALTGFSGVVIWTLVIFAAAIILHFKAAWRYLGDEEREHKTFEATMKRQFVD